MSDPELEKLVDSGDDFTEEAEAALREELSKRGLQWRAEAAEEEVVEPAEEKVGVVEDEEPGLEVPELEDPVTIRKFQDLSEALIARSKLDSAEIPSMISDANMARMNWFWSNMLGGIRLQVSRADAEAAIAILDEPIPETLDVEGIGQVEQPRCPKCQSLDIRYESINKEASFASMIIAPIPFPADRWKCNSCGQYWQEIPDEDEQTKATE